MKEFKCSTYRIISDKIISGGHLGSWKKGSEPTVITLIPIAKYLGVTLDYLVGREQ
ncbi:MAG: hypothetical protein FWC82_03855 [Firmicutes bacterium]|nr:hypothetical protein [Bacillota bacterium]